MHLEKCKREIVAFVDVELAMLELRTPFDEKLTSKILDLEIKKLFPHRVEKGERLVPIPLLSFNVAEGRLHRVCLFFIPPKMNFENTADRVLPKISALTAMAEKQMESGEGMENLLYVAYQEDMFYGLFFMEGRLVHLWREPCPSRVFGAERLASIQDFLRKDLIFSRIKAFTYEEPKPYFDWKQSGSDFFWRTVDLEYSVHWKPRYKRRRLALALLLCVLGVAFFSIGNLREGFYLNSKQAESRAFLDLERRKEAFNQKFDAWSHLPEVRHVPLKIHEIVYLPNFSEKSFQQIEGEYGAGGWFLQFQYFEKNNRLDSLLSSIKKQGALKDWVLDGRKWWRGGMESGNLEGWYVF